MSTLIRVAFATRQNALLSMPADIFRNSLSLARGKGPRPAACLTGILLRLQPVDRLRWQRRARMCITIGAQDAWDGRPSVERADASRSQ
jgi:hypothetical protein